MADLVNPTSREQLTARNSEPSNLKGGSFDTLGGPTWDNTGGPDAYKIDASRGVNTDTTIPKATGAEPTHLKTEDDENPDVEVDFGDGPADDVDDLDRKLDEFDDAGEVDVDVAVDDDDEDDLKEGEEIVIKKDGDDKDGDKEDVKESDDDDADDKKDDLEEGGLPPWLKKKGKKLKEEDDEDNKDDDELKEGGGIANFKGKKAKPFVKEDDDNDADDKKDDLEEDDEIVIKKDGDDDEKKDDEKPDVKAESVKIRIKMPDVKLFESVNMTRKTQKKVGVNFEAAVRDTTKQISRQLARHYAKLHEARITQRDAVMAKQVDAYLSYVTEEYVKTNRVAIRQSLRTQLAEEFLTGLQRLFKEHYIDVPESKVNVVAKLTEETRELKRKLNEEHSKKMKLHRLAESCNKARIVAESARGLSTASAAKLLKLAENTPYTSAKDFREKVGMLRESYMPKTEDKKLNRLGEDDVQEQTAAPKSSRVSDDATVDAAAKALTASAAADKW